ncbi:MAG: SpoIID/LytB domain-containing protein, partial [bacterium]
MKNAITHLLALCLALALCVSLSPPVGAEYVPPVELLKIGLYNDGQKTYPSANLQNGTELGWGYRFGWYDKNRVFHDLDVTVTDTNKISMCVDKNLVWDAAERTYKEGTEGSVVVGCFHVQVNSAFSTAEEAMEVAVPLNGGGRNVFLRFSDGSFYVCIGSFLSREAAEAYGEELNLRDWSVTSGTSRTVSVTETGTSRILFEFDYGSTASLAVRPLAEGKKAQTYFKGYLYYGDFAYIRPAAGQLTVVNYVPIEDYVKGVLPYEMDASWPME